MLNKVENKYELYDEIIRMGRSIVLVGPINSFDIEYTGNRPRLWVTGRNNLQIEIPCTDHAFCQFISNKSAVFASNLLPIISSENLLESQNRTMYVVIGLTGDHLDENGEIVSGKYAPPGTTIEPRYWPMAVSVLTIPSYL